jgi:uncharacterized membrane protein YjdF
LREYFKKKKFPSIIQNLVILVLYFTFLFLQVQFNFYIEPFIIFLLIIAVLGHLFIGEYLGIYVRIKIYDKFLHVFGTFAFTLFFYSLILKTINPLSEPKTYTLLFIVALGVSLGAIFELIEFTVDLIFKSKSQTDLMDTDIDLIADLIGSIVAAFTYTFFILS